MRKTRILAFLLVFFLACTSGKNVVSANAVMLQQSVTTAQQSDATTAQQSDTTTAQQSDATTAQQSDTTTAQQEETQPSTPIADTVVPSLEEALKSVSSFIIKNDTNPDSESSWFVISLMRSDTSVPKSYKDTYYRNVLTQLVKSDWSITKSKYSEYSKLIIGLTAIGKDARDIAGHNMLSYLSDFTDVKRQGFNGTVWALLALNCHDSYEIPINPDAKEQVTEEGLIQTILGSELSPGGWALYGGEPDADMTGMTIQALSAYYGKREDVTKAIDRAVNWLSTAQLSSGGYQTIGTETAESVAQVITALSAIGIDCGKDARFIKNGKWPMTGLMQYYLLDGSFAHSTDSGYNGLATAQSMYSLVSYQRMLEGKNFTYHMTEIPLESGKMLTDLDLDDEEEKTDDEADKKKEETKKDKKDKEKKDSSKTKTTAKTKTLGKLQLSGSKNVNKKKETAKEDKETTETEETGWSFEGAEYVPETIADGENEAGEDEEQKNGIAAYFPDDMTAEGYMAVGASGILFVEVLIWLFLKATKKVKKKKIETKSGSAS